MYAHLLARRFGDVSLKKIWGQEERHLEAK